MCFSNRLLFFCGSKLIQDYSNTQRENLTWNSDISRLWGIVRIVSTWQIACVFLVTIPETLLGLSDDSQGTNFFQRCRCGWHRCGSCCPAIDRWVVTDSSDKNPTSSSGWHRFHFKGIVVVCCLANRMREQKQYVWQRIKLQRMKDA